MRRREKDMRRRWLTWIRGKRQGDTFSVVVVFFVVYEIRSRETGRGVRPKEEGVAERLRLNYFTCRRILSFFPSTLYCYSPEPLSNLIIPSTVLRFTPFHISHRIISLSPASIYLARPCSGTRIGTGLCGEEGDKGTWWVSR